MDVATVIKMAYTHRKASVYYTVILLQHRIAELSESKTIQNKVRKLFSVIDLVGEYDQMQGQSKLTVKNANVNL